MNVIPAWLEGITGRGAVVTILDDGLEKDHPDLVQNYVKYHLLTHILAKKRITEIISGPDGIVRC